jgi:WD40 repeat protein
LGVAFSPDGTLLAAAYGDGYVRLWNPVTRQGVGAPLPGYTSRVAGVNGVAFSPDGKMLASAAATAPYGRGRCRFSLIRTSHYVPMSGRQQRQIGRITPRVNHSPASADDTYRFPPAQV